MQTDSRAARHDLFALAEEFAILAHFTVNSCNQHLAIGGLDL
jgi:hypothetical protein